MSNRLPDSVLKRYDFSARSREDMAAAILDTDAQKRSAGDRWPIAFDLSIHTRLDDYDLARQFVADRGEIRSEYAAAPKPGSDAAIILAAAFAVALTDHSGRLYEWGRESALGELFREYGTIHADGTLADSYHATPYEDGYTVFASMQGNGGKWFVPQSIHTPPGPEDANGYRLDGWDFDLDGLDRDDLREILTGKHDDDDNGTSRQVYITPFWAVRYLYRIVQDWKVALSPKNVNGAVEHGALYTLTQAADLADEAARLRLALKLLAAPEDYASAWEDTLAAEADAVQAGAEPLTGFSKAASVESCTDALRGAVARALERNGQPITAAQEAPAPAGWAEAEGGTVAEDAPAYDASAPPVQPLNACGLSLRDRALILAGLRLLQAELEEIGKAEGYLTNGIFDIATDSGRHPIPEPHDAEDLAERINFAS